MESSRELQAVHHSCGWHLTATILTSDAAQTLENIHDHNPVILPKEMWAHWIDPTATGDQVFVDEAVRAGATQASRLEFYEVAPLTGDGPQLVKPANAH